MQININDKKLLDFCSSNIHSVGEVARELKIAPKSISVRLKKLVDMKLIEVQKGGLGKKTFVKTIKNKKLKTPKLVFEILKEIKKAQKNKNCVIEMECFNKLRLENKDYFDIMRAMNYIKLSKLVGFVLTPEGKKFLK